MNETSAVTVVGGLGLFLLGIHHLTEGLKGLAGDSLRRALQTLVGGRLSAVISGALFTVALQSSTATTLTVIGFVSAGLVTFSQAVGVIIGATFGTTSTPWLVAFFGFRLRISAFALPMVGIGAFLWLIARAKRVRPEPSWRASDCSLSGSTICRTGWRASPGTSMPLAEAVLAGNGFSQESAS